MLLLDTHLLIWGAFLPERLSTKARRTVDDAVEVYFSVASLWEVAIKFGNGRSDFNFDPAELRTELLGRGYRELAIFSDHALAAVMLPAIHRDPFDRMLIAQARVERLHLVTADRLVASYDSQILLV